MQEDKIVVGITHGDINGVGYEVIFKALADERMLELCTPVIYGSGKIAAQYRRTISEQMPQFRQINDASEADDSQINLVNVVGEDVQAEPGVASAAAGEAAFKALERAVADLQSGDIDVLVTAPIDKHSIQSERFSFPGHTEYLEASLAREGEDDKALMVLCNDVLRVALVTTHLPISQVAGAITKDSVLDKIRRFNRSLTRDFMLPHPRIAVLALNPHAGEEGLLGKEEEEEIKPAVAAAREERINCFGPYAADGFFGNGSYKKFDGVLAMYHDQGLAPFKTIGMDQGVNFTAGLDYVRTSPDHGTAFDIAGKDMANAASMREAIYMAIDVARARERHDEACANPLRRQYVEKNKNDNVVLTEEK